MVKRLFDLLAASVGLLLAAPVLLVAALGIRLTSAGPVIYRATRVGLRGRPFIMYKLRTMASNPAHPRVRVTGVADARVFPFARLLRRTKIDELPQLVNVLRGEMSIVGPRPEEADLVARYYTKPHWETLGVRPGLVSPGALYQYAQGDTLLAGDDPEASYVRRLLPIKIALDRVYLRRASFWYDLTIIGRTIVTIAAMLAGRRRFPDPPEMAAVRHLLPRAGGAMARRRTFGAALVAALTLLVAACLVEPDAPSAPDPEGSTVATMVGAGDIASCFHDDDEATAALLDSLSGTVFTLGDNAYDDGSIEEYEECYAPTWGRHRDRTRPVPGNHEYHTPDAAGYFDYFGSAAGERGKGYYSYDLGPWHVIALNSELDMDAGSPQLTWLRDDLDAHPTLCTLAYWHHPRFSSGSAHGSSTQSLAAWEALYAAGVELVLVGHEHHFERFAPQTPDGAADPSNGIRQFVVGTGGDATYGFGTPIANSEVRLTDVPGVLALTLLPEGYEWAFLSTAGGAVADSGSAGCHGPSSSTAPRNTAPVLAAEVDRPLGGPEVP